MTNASPMKHEEYAGERARGSWILRPDSVANVKCTGVDANFFASLREGAPDFSTSPKKPTRGSFASPNRPRRPPPMLQTTGAISKEEAAAMFLPLGDDDADPDARALDAAPNSPDSDLY